MFATTAATPIPPTSESTSLALADEVSVAVVKYRAERGLSRTMDVGGAVLAFPRCDGAASMTRVG